MEVSTRCYEEYLKIFTRTSSTVGEFMNAPASKWHPEPAPSGLKENEAGQASKLAQLESLLSAERRTLELISSGAGLTAILEDLCDSMDAHSPESISCILLMDYAGERVWHRTGPRV